MNIKVSNTCLGEHIVYSNTDIALQLSIQQLKIFNTPIYDDSPYESSGLQYKYKLPMQSVPITIKVVSSKPP